MASAVDPTMPADAAPQYCPSIRQRSHSASRPHPDTRGYRFSPLTRVTAAGRSLRTKSGFMGLARRSLGIALLLITVFLWTLSNFLASYIFSDHTYDKPFFLVYLNTSVLAVSLLPPAARHLSRHGLRGLARSARHAKDDEDTLAATERLLPGGDPPTPATGGGGEDKLSARATARLALGFCLLWFVANYLAVACLEHTSVGSVTILTSTSSVWTLVLCAASGVERFSARKLAGVLASLAGVALVSSVDLSGSADADRGSFPSKTVAEVALGDAMALASAVVYGVYVTVMKWRVGSEERVDMLLFFGLVGLFNMLFLWPGFFILHFTGIEPFAPPPTSKVWAILLINAASSLISDIAWAYAMLLTTPLVVTVGLSLTIPLSLIGEIVQYARYSSWIYWAGAVVVFFSFLFVNHESQDGKDDRSSRQTVEGQLLAGADGED